MKRHAYSYVVSSFTKMDETSWAPSIVWKVMKILVYTGLAFLCLDIKHGSSAVAWDENLFLAQRAARHWMAQKGGLKCVRQIRLVHFYLVSILGKLYKTFWTPYIINQCCKCISFCLLKNSWVRNNYTAWPRSLVNYWIVGMLWKFDKTIWTQV